MVWLDLWDKIMNELHMVLYVSWKLMKNCFLYELFHISSSNN